MSMIPSGAMDETYPVFHEAKRLTKEPRRIMGKTICSVCGEQMEGLAWQGHKELHEGEIDLAEQSWDSYITALGSQPAKPEGHMGRVLKWAHYSQVAEQLGRTPRIEVNSNPRWAKAEMRESLMPTQLGVTINTGSGEKECVYAYSDPKEESGE